MNFRIRAATKEDCEDILRLIKELAVTGEMKMSTEVLEREGFCQIPLFECFVAEVPEDQKSSEGFTIVGHSLYYYTYNSWTGRSVYIANLYVMEEFRGKGIGTGLMSKVTEAGKKKQCVRLELCVREWNTYARNFYAAKGAQDLTVSEGRHCFCFEGQNLINLANEAPKDYQLALLDS